ncbi:TPA: hypothetical protein RQK07_002195 [Vibrio vulnificus]|nr:hypothetical protein [Vibrio vulnificus]HDY7688328.1 hypothetical protein [Vibrio vulnificus]
MDEKQLIELEDKAFELRKHLLTLCNQTLMHIGGDFSVVEIMTVLWQYAINYDVNNPQWEQRDRFVLSKGHAAAVTSFSQAIRGCYDGRIHIVSATQTNKMMSCHNSYFSSRQEVKNYAL